MHLTNPFEDKIAIVIDAADGIAAEIARHLASAGAQVVVSYRTAHRQTAENVVEEIFAGGGRAWAVPGDPSSDTEVRHLLEQTEDGFGEPDIIVAAVDASSESEGLAGLPARCGAHACKVCMLPCAMNSDMAATDYPCDPNGTLDAALKAALLCIATATEKRDMRRHHTDRMLTTMTERRMARAPYPADACGDGTQPAIFAAARTMRSTGRRRRRFSIRG